MAREWELTEKEGQDVVVATRDNYAGAIARAAVTKLLRWQMGWCDEHLDGMHGLKLLRLECPACLQELCQELGVE